MAATSYCTLEEALAWTGLENADRDDEVYAAIVTASAAITRHCNADLGLLTTTETVFGLGADLLFPKRGPLVTVISCTDEQARSIPVRRSADAVKRTDGQVFVRDAEYTLSYSAGLDPLPEDLKLACKITVSGLLTAAAYDPNLQSESLGGNIGGAFAGAGPGSLPPAALSLLVKFRRLTPF